MRWFGFQEEPSTTRPLPGPQFSSGRHSFLALNVLFHQLQSKEKNHILDLGPAFGTNVDFFSQFSCKIYIEDLYDTLASFDYLSPEDGFSYQAVYSYLLPYRSNTRFDAIVTWDLFNYLDRNEFRHLVRHLGRFCQPGTLLFSLISTLKHIPEKPTHFKILDAETLDYAVKSQVLRLCPRYGQSDLNQMMPRFRVSSSFQLRNGFKEYLFQYE